MALPYVKINFANGALGTTEAMDDGVTLMIVSGLTTDIDCQNYTDYLSKIGTDGTALPEVEAFYNEVGGNARLILTTCELSATALEAEISKYNGEIRNVVVSGVDSDDTMAVLQTVGEYTANTLYAPVMFLVGGTETYIASYKTDSKKFSSLEKDRIAVVDSVVDGTDSDTAVALLYYVAGRLASIPVQRSLARVKDGALYKSAYYTASGTLVDNTYAEERHALGTITVRTFVGKAGYYISDDLVATSATSDYALIPRRRVVDKAFRIAYTTLVDYIGDEIPVTDDGTIPTSICKEIENSVEHNIEVEMTNNGNLGRDTTDPNDTGVECYVDPSQDVVSTSKINVVLKVKPYGYAKYIEVDLGFYTTD